MDRSAWAAPQYGHRTLHTRNTGVRRETLMKKKHAEERTRQLGQPWAANLYLALHEGLVGVGL